MQFFNKINNCQLLPSADTVVTIVYTVLPVCMAGDGYPPLLHTGSCPRPCQWWVITGEQRHTHPLLGAPAGLLWYIQFEAGRSRASNKGLQRFNNHITENVPTRDFSWLIAPTSTFTFKTLLRCNLNTLIGAFSMM